MARINNPKYGEDHPNFKHCGRQRFRKEYMAWMNMKGRCLRPDCDTYKYYGGRGIKIFEGWINDFNCFLKDVGVAPSPLHSLEREDNDGHYVPGNVIWATKDVQMSNRRNNRWIEYQGDRMIMADWAKLFGVEPTNLLKMIKKYPFERIYSFYKPRIKPPAAVLQEIDPLKKKLQ
jgi:hypothetical protein